MVASYSRGDAHALESSRVEVVPHPCKAEILACARLVLALYCSLQTHGLVVQLQREPLLCKQLLTVGKSISAYVQDNFSNDARDYLVLPLVAQTLKTATTALHKVNRTQGLVRNPSGAYCSRRSIRRRHLGCCSIIDDLVVTMPPQPKLLHHGLLLLPRLSTLDVATLPSAGGRSDGCLQLLHTHYPGGQGQGTAVSRASRSLTPAWPLQRPAAHAQHLFTASRAVCVHPGWQTPCRPPQAH